MPFILNVNVKNKIAKGDGQIVVCDNSDYIVNFDFDSEWDEFTVKTMRLVFSNGEFNEVVFEGNQCELPVIQSRNGFSIGVYAGNIHTTVSAWFDCAKSILTDGEQHGEPLPDVYAQIIEMIESGMIKGDPGDPGNGIDDIELISTVGRVKTYRITFTDGTHFDYDVTDGEKGEKGDKGDPGDPTDINLNAGLAPAAVQNTHSIAGALGFYFKDTSVSGTTFTATLLDKDGNEVVLPVRGDLNGDGVVSDTDYQYLYSHVANPSDYPLNQDADFNGDGVVNEGDWNYLMYHTFYPDDPRYALANPVISCKAGYLWNLCGRITAVSGSTITVTLDSTPPSTWVPGDYEFDPEDLEYSGYIWFPFGPQAGTVAIGEGALAVGNNNMANGKGTFTSGSNNTADGDASTASGVGNNSAGYCSNAEGEGNFAKGSHQRVQGKYSVPLDGNYPMVIGWGNDNANRKNIVAIDKDGNLYIRGTVYVLNNSDDCLNGGQGVATSAVSPWKTFRFGELSWKYADGVFYATLPTAIYNAIVSGGAAQEARTTICRAYTYHAYEPTNKTYVVGNYMTKGIHVKDTSYTDAAAFAAAKANTIFYYLE